MSNTAVTDRPRQVAGARRGRGQRPAGYVWIIPAMIVSVGLIYYSIGYTGYISTLDWDGLSPDPTHVGADNFARVFQDPVFWLAILHTIVFFVITFTLQTALGFVVAVLLHTKVRLSGLYRVIIFLPVIIAPAISAPVFRQIFAADGQLNWILEHVGLGFLAQPWLAQSETALPVIIVITLWHWTGLTFILYYSALGQIEPEVLEAARLDGAGSIRTTVSIIWPNVRGTTTVLATLSAINALKTFDVPYLVTRGGPNFATEFLGTLIYRETIPLAEVGYGAALSIMLLILALGMAIPFSLTGNRRERVR